MTFKSVGMPRSQANVNATMQLTYESTDTEGGSTGISVIEDDAQGTSTDLESDITTLSNISTNSSSIYIIQVQVLILAVILVVPVSQNQQSYQSPGLLSGKEASTSKIGNWDQLTFQLLISQRRDTSRKRLDLPAIIHIPIEKLDYYTCALVSK